MSDYDDSPVRRGRNIPASKTVIEGKKKLDFSEYYEIQLWDMRAPKTDPKCNLNLQTASNDSFNSHSTNSCKVARIVKAIFVPLLIISSLSLLILLVSVLDNRLAQSKIDQSHCVSSCRINLVESIPENLTYPQGSPIFPSTFSAWKSLINKANRSIDLAVFYWSLKNEDVTPIKMASAWEGEEIFKQLLDTAANKKEVKIRIAQNKPSDISPQNNSRILEQEGAKVRSLDFDRLMGAGVLHTKLWIVDDSHFYIGSANMDWQSLTQVKEVGLLVEDCPCLAQDIKKIFEVYWFLGQNSATIPTSWPEELHTKFNVQNPMKISFSDQNASAFISSSPLPFNPAGRTNDVDAIISIIRSAEKFVYIAVMDYFPRMLYTKDISYWPVIDDELRRAALERRVHVRLLTSHWNHTRKDMVRWMKSLQDLSGSHYPSIAIETKLFVVPVYTKEQSELPYARVNHNKYMVTDKTAYVGTSNWSGDYFTNTGGVSLSITEDGNLGSKRLGRRNDTTLRAQLESLFLRDWKSEYAKPIDAFL